MLSRLSCVVIVFCCTALRTMGAEEPAGTPPRISDGKPLEGTQPLTWEGDLPARMVDDLHRFADRETAASIERRARHWKRNYSNLQDYQLSISPNRERLAKYLGVPFNSTRDMGPRTYPTLVSVAGSSNGSVQDPTKSAAGAPVQWRARDGRTAYGRYFPSRGGQQRGIAIVVVDPHLQPQPEQQIYLPLQLAQVGYNVFVTTVVDRNTQLSVVAAGDNNARHTGLSHREFVHRQAFEMGRTVLGYEVCNVLGLVDMQQHGANVFGFGVGGDVALYAGALDTRIHTVGVCASFGSKQELWRRPLDYDIWGFLDEFGDAELLSMIAGRSAIIDLGIGFRYELPPVADSAKSRAAPGEMTMPSAEDGERELQRAEELVSALKSRPEYARFRLSKAHDAGTGNPKPFDAWFEWLEQKAGVGRPQIESEKVLFRSAVAPPLDELAKAATQGMIDHTQALMRESEYVRRDYWKNAERRNFIPVWNDFVQNHRKKFYDEVIGRFEYQIGSPNARTRLVYDTPKYLGYEVVLDVFGIEDEKSGGVWASGILLVPKDIRPGDRRPVVVCQHGLEGRPEDTILAGVKGSNYYHEFAAKLAEHGFVTFSPQNPYIGMTHFRQLVRKLHPLKKTLWSVIVPQHEQITHWLSSLEFVDGKRIGFYGLSYGGKTAMRVPALVDRYCLSICSGDFNEWIRKCVSVRDTYSYMGTHEYEMYEFDLGNTYNYAEMANMISPRPFMVERGHRDGVGVDEWVSYEYAKVRMLYADLKIPERTEIEYFDGPHEIHAVGTFDFLHRHLNWPAPK